jgi:hypothetical protein
MQFEKFKAKAKEALSNFPAFADWAKPKARVLARRPGLRSGPVPTRLRTIE